MGVVSTGVFPNFIGLKAGAVKAFGMAYKDHDRLYEKMFEKFTSTRSFEEDTLTAGLGLASQKTEGNAVAADAYKQGYTKRYTHTAYGNMFVLTREMVEDGEAELLVAMRSKGLKRSMLQTNETLGANVFNNGFDSNFTGGDGKELFATDHPTQGADLSNELATATDLSEASLEQMLIDISNFDDDRGRPIAARGRKLVVPTGLAFEAERLLVSNLRVGSANNDINAVRSTNALPEGYIVNPFLTDADAWFVLTDVDNGLKYWTRREMEITQDNDFTTENMLVKATMRVSFGWTDPRGAAGSPGA